MNKLINGIPRGLIERAWRQLANYDTGRLLGAYLDADPCAPECSETCVRSAMCTTCSAMLAAEQPPVQEPVAYVTGYYAGTCVVAPVNNAAVLPTHMALYAAPQPSDDVASVQDEFAKGQWWIAELDKMVEGGTPDQKRAVAVVHNLLSQVAAPQPVSDDARDALVEALEVLAKLGNGEHYGNSDGNVIAQRALAAYRAANPA